MKALGRQGDWESQTDAKVPAPAEIATRLGVAEGELCVRTVYEFLADGRPVQLSASWEPYDLTAGTLVVLPEGGPHAGAGVVNRMAAIGVTVSHAVEQPEPRQARTSGGRTTATRGGPWRPRTSRCPPRTARSSTRSRSAGDRAACGADPNTSLLVLDAEGCTTVGTSGCYSASDVSSGAVCVSDP